MPLVNADESQFKQYRFGFSHVIPAPDRDTVIKAREMIKPSFLMLCLGSLLQKSPPIRVPQYCLPLPIPGFSFIILEIIINMCLRWE